MKNRIAVSLIAVSMLASGAAFAQSTTEQGAREGAPFIRWHLIEPTTVAFDDFVVGGADTAENSASLGLT